MIYGEDSKMEDMVTGLEAIKAKMAERSSRRWLLNLEDGSVDAQESMQGGVILLVTGTITSKQHPEPRQVLFNLILCRCDEACDKNELNNIYSLQ
jgi:hypothetical protein